MGNAEGSRRIMSISCPRDGSGMDRNIGERGRASSHHEHQLLLVLGSMENTEGPMRIMSISCLEMDAEHA